VLVDVEGHLLGVLVLPADVSDRDGAERFFGWITHCRRLARDYERQPTYSEAWVYLTETHRLLKHLAPDDSLPVPYQRREAAWPLPDTL
jgi:hypothetical protein